MNGNWVSVATFGKAAPYIQAGLNSAAANVLTQGISVAVGLQDKFSWRDVAASAAGAAVGKGVSNAIGGRLDGLGKAGGVLKDAAAGFAGGVTSAVVRGGKIDYVSIITDVFGNAIANSMVDKLLTRPAKPEPAPGSGDALAAGVAGELDEVQVTARALTNNPDSVKTPANALSPDQQRDKSRASSGPADPAPTNAIPAGSAAEEVLDEIVITAVRNSGVERWYQIAPDAAESKIKSLKKTNLKGPKITFSPDDKADRWRYAKGTEAKDANGQVIKKGGRFTESIWDRDLNQDYQRPQLETEASINIRGEKKLLEYKGEVNLLGDGDLVTLRTEDKVLAEGSAKIDLKQLNKSELNAKVVATTATELQYARARGQGTLAGTDLAGEVQVRSAASAGLEGGLKIDKDGARLEAGVSAELVALQARAEGSASFEIFGVKIKLLGEGAVNAGAIGGSAQGSATLEKGRIAVKAGASASVLFGVKIRVGVDIDYSGALKRLSDWWD